MSTEQFARRIDQILRRLDVLEAQSKINYSTSTYTPTYTGQTTAGVTTYSLQTGGYRIIGSMCIATAAIAWTAATGTGNARFSLPFAAAQLGSGGVRIDGVTFANSAPGINLASGNSFFTLLSPITNAGGTTVQMEAAGNIVYTVIFFI